MPTPPQRKMSSASLADVGLSSSSLLPEAQSPFRSPSIRREPKLSGNNLRTLFRSSGQPPDLFIGADGDFGMESTAPVLPPTPPHAEDGLVEDEMSSSDTTKLRSVLVTPVNQLSPPTPDITPPREPASRHFLGARPSMASTYAESFRTAQEDIASNADSTLSLPLSRKAFLYQHSPGLLPFQQNEHKPSPLSQTLLVPQGHEEAHLLSNLHDLTLEGTEQQPNVIRGPEKFYEENATTPQGVYSNITEPNNVRLSFSAHVHATPQKAEARRGPSLRKRLEESQSIPRTSSIDKFANIIGWSETVHAEEKKRLSDLSASTVEAIVFATPSASQRRGTLRHVSKHDSLRSASSPLMPSNRPSSQANSDSPHRLTHKKAKLSNRNRQSFGSDHSRSFSLGSSIPPAKMEIIKVAVIPERLSSLQSSSNAASRRHSRSASVDSVPLRTRRKSNSQSDIPFRDRTTLENGDRARGRYYPPQVGPFVVPPRASSLSAPTSRTTSRANSLNSDSLRSARKQAEKDLRSTLNKMESERLTSNLIGLSKQSEQSRTPIGRQPWPDTSDIQAHDFATAAHSGLPLVIPGTAEWADLRPPSLLATPFSAPSFLSASPEISEAKAISLYPHNNHSIQLIEPFPMPESQAVILVRGKGTYDIRGESPFRDPRAAPNPPKVGFAITNNTNGHGQAPATSEDPNVDELRSPQTKQQESHGTKSLAQSIMRSVSLKHAWNRKANQRLDPGSHPMWRPQAFWNDPDARRKAPKEAPLERGTVQNSVGIPQQRSTFIGPIGLMHRLSNRRRNKKVVARQSSYNSLHRLRTGRKLYRIPGLGIHLQLMGLKDIQERVGKSRLRKEDDAREKRREELRKSIGPNVISMGDSRFPVSLADNNSSRHA